MDASPVARATRDLSYHSYPQLLCELQFTVAPGYLIGIATFTSTE
jgi:hypothetical protein